MVLATRRQRALPCGSGFFKLHRGPSVTTTTGVETRIKVSRICTVLLVVSGIQLSIIPSRGTFSVFASPFAPKGSLGWTTGDVEGLGTSWQAASWTVGGSSQDDMARIRKESNFMIPFVHFVPFFTIHGERIIKLSIHKTRPI